MGRRLVVACVDFRMNDILDREYNDGNTIFARTEGAFASRIMGTIEDAIINRGVTHIHFLGHKGRCAAVGKYMENFLRGSHADVIDKDSLNLLLTGVARNAAVPSSSEEAEEMNSQRQAELTRDRFSNYVGLKISHGIVDLSRAHHNANINVVVTNATTWSTRRIRAEAGIDARSSSTFIVSTSVPRETTAPLRFVTYAIEDLINSNKASNSREIMVVKSTEPGEWTWNGGIPEAIQAMRKVSIYCNTDPFKDWEMKVFNPLAQGRPEFLANWNVSLLRNGSCAALEVRAPGDETVRRVPARERIRARM
ncbi:MAG: hypothetical protein M1321_01580 [Candidatus Marsarchaeota archaeon]|nr:hypothetical protein [Candidatus Marsarchaeota archaeon]